MGDGGRSFFIYQGHFRIPEIGVRYRRTRCYCHRRDEPTISHKDLLAELNNVDLLYGHMETICPKCPEKIPKETILKIWAADDELA